jgi:hypothetical protein
MTDLLAGAEIAGYRIEAIAGRGGMGVVYRATDLTLERVVALKVISDEFAQDASFRERFKRESRLAASISHPNVITVFGAGEEGGRLYITMDFIEGTDLKTLIAQQGRLEPGLAANIVAQVASALDEAHAKTLVHRDVKPANVLIAGEGDSLHAYLTDFGLTKHTTSQSAMTQTGMVVGTIDYMAPEQIAGARLDARADVYSLGCVLYEALTGQVPYPKESNVAKMFAHASELPPSVAAAAPDIAPGFDAIISRAMAKDADERYLSAGDLGRAARAAAEGTRVAQVERSVAAGEAAPATAHADAAPPTPAGATRPATPSPRAPRRRRSLVLVAAALLAAAGAAAVLLAGGSGDERPARLSKDQYQDQVLDASRPFTRQAALTTNLPAHVLKPQDALKAAAQLATYRKATDRLIASLQHMTPPADITGVHRRVIADVVRIRGHIADAGAAADFGNDRVYRSIPAKLDKDFAALTSLRAAFEARGYKRLAF